MIFPKIDFVLLSALILGACGSASAPTTSSPPSPSPSAQMNEVTFQVVAPPETPANETLYLRTNMIFAVDEEELAMTQDQDGIWNLTLSIPKGLVFRYRYTLGASWDKEESYPLRATLFHYRQVAVASADSQTVRDVVGRWEHLSPTQDRTGTIEGRVTSSETGLPILGVAVSCGPFQTQTGYDGRFRIQSIGSGTNTLSVYLDDGSFVAQTADVTLSTGQTTTQNFQLAPARMATLDFRAQAPADTPTGAIVRMMGDRQRLGLFHFYEGTAFDSTRALSMTDLGGGSWSYSTTLGEGSAVYYVYTLGDTRVNQERDSSDESVLRVVQVDGDATIQDTVESWKASNEVALTLTVNAPNDDPVYVTNDGWDFYEPLKMWSLGSRQWTYTFMTAPNADFRYRYIRFGDTKSGHEKLTPDTNTSYRSVNVPSGGNNQTDTILTWRHQLRETIPSPVTLRYSLRDTTAIPARTSGQSFQTGIEFMDFWLTSWQPLIASNAAHWKSKNTEWAQIASVWGIMSTDPPLIDLAGNGFPIQELREHIRALKSEGIKVAVRAFAYPAPAPYAGFTRSNTDAWYDAFFAELERCFLIHAAILQEEGVEMMMLPNFNWEDDNNSTKRAYINQKWKTLIATIRTVYTGKLTIDYFVERDEYDWYGDLDYLGDKWWWSIADNTSFTVDQMVTRALQRLNDTYLPRKNRFNKPFIFSEYAFYSADSSALQTYGVSSSQISPFGPEDAAVASAWQQQADAIEALLWAFAQTPWVEGAYAFGVWYFDTDAKDYSLRGKTSQEVVSQMYQRINAAQ